MDNHHADDGRPPGLPESRENHPQTQVILPCNFIYELSHEHLVEADARFMFSKTVSLKELHAAVRLTPVTIVLSSVTPDQGQSSCATEMTIFPCTRRSSTYRIASGMSLSG